MKEKVCLVCGMPESEIVRLGMKLNPLLGKLGVPIPGNEEDDVWVCDFCIKKKKVSGELEIKVLMESIGQSEAFSDYISCSASLFKLDIRNVCQACFNILISGIRYIASDISKGLAIAIIKTSISVLENEKKLLEESKNGNSPENR